MICPHFFVKSLTNTAITWLQVCATRYFLKLISCINKMPWTWSYHEFKVLSTSNRLINYIHYLPTNNKTIYYKHGSTFQNNACLHKDLRPTLICLSCVYINCVRVSLCVKLYTNQKQIVVFFNNVQDISIKHRG